MPKSIETAIDISQPPATLPEITTIPVPTGPYSPTGEIVFNPTPPVATKATQVHLRLDNAEHYYRPTRGRRSRGSRGHGSSRCGACKECRSSQGFLVRNRCRGGMVRQLGRPNMVIFDK